MTKGLSYELIKSAASGNSEAINKIIKIYEPYMNTLSSRKLYDEAGNEFIGVDVDLYDYLKTRLITVIMRFDVA